jgi:hypothetical protein
MSFFRQITNAIFSATNENNLQLASLKWDFSLVKVEAPAEFAALGSALTTKRRNEAEEGAQHRTARRLAALFEQLIPSTPKLVTAYGIRVSEIIQKPHVNPQGSHSHGPFRDFIGADGTAIWAAATSGIPALGVYLLACLLARAWGPPSAVSIWVELVSERRKEVQEELKSHVIVSQSSLEGARQTISRDDLALLDASARSWLRSADQGKRVEQDQLMLILKNIGLPFAAGPSTYKKVISDWQQAMIGMENLLCGRPQSISGASVILALASWHLFPDLIVLRNDIPNIKFKDPLFPSTGVGTIGITYEDSSQNPGLQWSLMLSHLVYYGDEVKVDSKKDFSRISMEQLRLVAFGSMLSAWKINFREFLSAAAWFRSLWVVLSQKRPTTSELCHQFAWLSVLVQAAESLLLAQSEKHGDALKLVDYGYRNAKFLGIGHGLLQPYFGLCNPFILAGLTEKLDFECGVSYLRAIAKFLNLKSGTAIIICRHWLDGAPVNVGLPDYYEYATAVGHPRASRHQSSECDPEPQVCHARWFHIGPKGMQNGEVSAEVERRAAYVKSRNEASYLVGHGPDIETQPHHVHKKPKLSRSTVCWEKPPSVFREHGQPNDGVLAVPHDAESSRARPPPITCEMGCQCFHPIEGGESMNSFDAQPAYFSSIMGEIIADTHIGLYVRHQPNDDEMVKRYSKKCVHSTYQRIDPMTGATWMTQSLCGARLWDYLCSITTQSWPRKARDDFSIRYSHFSSSFLSITNKLPKPLCKSLNALYAAGQTYSGMVGATISLSIISRPLHDALWVPALVEDRSQAGRRSRPSRFNMQDEDEPIIHGPILDIQSRSQAFACITHLDSGTLVLNPKDFDDTLAVCSEDSIYVTSVLLSDPAETVAPNSIRRLVGNIGRPGVCMLVAPMNPKIRRQKYDYSIVTHAPFDLKREDNFRDTTLHLSFTDWTLPIETGDSRTIDQEVYLVEAVVSVHDRGEWVADLDILEIDFTGLTRLGTNIECPGIHEEERNVDYTSLDSWDELLEPPVSVGILRAHGNWVARLAAVSILSQKGQGHSVGIFDHRKFCLKCLEVRWAAPWVEAGLAPFESTLPSFCID